jgi:hypothetical protein
MQPPYSPWHDTLSSRMRIEIFTQRKKTRRNSIEFIKPYRFTSRKPDQEISFRTHFWSQWVTRNDFSLMSERTVYTFRAKKDRTCSIILNKKRIKTNSPFFLP